MEGTAVSLLKTIKAQLGLSGTPANNFTLDASANNGTMKLARGNAGATTQDVMTVDAAGKVAFPQNAQPAYFMASSMEGNGTVDGSLKLQFGTAALLNGTYVSGRFTPSVPGFYQCNAGLQVTATGTITFVGVSIKKNGAQALVDVDGPYASLYGAASCAGLVYMNGTTDYLEAFQNISITGTATISFATSSFVRVA